VVVHSAGVLWVRCRPPAGAHGATAIYGGQQGILAQLQRLDSAFQRQQRWHLYSASVLLVYEGDAAAGAQLGVRAWLVDFAHAFDVGSSRGPDRNFVQGLTGLQQQLQGVVAGGGGAAG
jgi:1D-myo-inositol-tetrakisphosphate 5-kinase/inositol-polyphosphate multikinase